MKRPGSTSSCPCEGCQERRKKEALKAAVRKSVSALSFRGLFSQELLSIQPMTLPAGLVFYIDYTYGEKKEEPYIDF